MVIEQERVSMQAKRCLDQVCNVECNFESAYPYIVSAHNMPVCTHGWLLHLMNRPKPTFRLSHFDAAIKTFPTLDKMQVILFFFSSRRRHTRLQGDWSSDVCSSDLFSPPEMITSLERPTIH